jgi:hypothetical protein
MIEAFNLDVSLHVISSNAVIINQLLRQFHKLKRCTVILMLCTAAQLENKPKWPDGGGGFLSPDSLAY